MERRTPLRRTPLARGKPPVRRAPLPRVSAKRSAKPSLRRSYKDTGPSRATRQLVLARDNNRCVRCGRPIRGRAYSLQHRIARGQGGTSDPAINRPSNLIVLCGTATSPDGCHYLAERRYQPERHAGYWLKRYQDPARTAVLHFERGWILLADDGTWTEAS